VRTKSVFSLREKEAAARQPPPPLGALLEYTHLIICTTMSPKCSVS